MCQASRAGKVPPRGVAHRKVLLVTGVTQQKSAP
jgi:hypothetical protein